MELVRIQVLKKKNVKVSGKVAVNGNKDENIHKQQSFVALTTDRRTKYLQKYQNSKMTIQFSDISEYYVCRSGYKRQELRYYGCCHPCFENIYQFAIK